MSVHSLAMMTFFRSVLLHPLDDVRVSPGVDPRAVEGLLVGEHRLQRRKERSAPLGEDRREQGRDAEELRRTSPVRDVDARLGIVATPGPENWKGTCSWSGSRSSPPRQWPAGISDSGSPGGRQTPGSSPRSGSRRSWPVRRPARQARLAEPGHPTPVGLGSAYASGPSESLTSLRALRVRSREPDRARPRSADHAGSSFVADPGSLDRASLRWPSGSSSSGRIGSGEDVQGPVGRERRSGRFSVRVWCPSCRVSARSDGTRRPQA